MSRHRSPASRQAQPTLPPPRRRRREGGGARAAAFSRIPAHRSAAVLVVIAAVIAVAGSVLSVGGVLGPSNANVDLAADDLAILPPAPTAPPTVPPVETTDPTSEAPEATTDAAETTEATTTEKEEAEEADGAGETAQPRAATRAVRFPGELIDAKKWYLTLPTGKEGSPDTVETEELPTYQSEYFQLTDAKDGVVFTANAGGATTANSKYPRSELREMDGGEKAAWDGRTGTHTMELDQAITKTPATKPDVIAGQIHGGSDDVMQIHLSGRKLTVKYADGDKEVVLDDAYQLGERFRVKIVSSDGHVKVWHNGELKADLPIYGSQSYFKAGAYVNSNPGKGASKSDIGQVVIYGVKITHS